MNARFVFIQPPTLSILEQRLRARGSETEESLKRRLESVAEDLAFAAQPGAYDLVVVNDDLEAAYAKFKRFVVESYQLEGHVKGSSPL